MSARSRRRPPLDQTIVADDEKLWDAVDRIIRNVDPELTEQVRRRQRQLRALVEVEGWEAYLKVEEATNARVEEQLIVLVRWAFESGVSASKRRGGA